MGTPGIEALEVYKAAVSETTGKPFSLIGHGHQVHLCEVLNELAPPGLDRRETLSWMAGRVREWVAEVDPTYTNGFAPAKLAVWLNNQTSPRASGVRMKTVARTGPQGPILKDLVGKP